MYLPILAAATTFLQQKISMVNTKDPTQNTMLYIMPLFMAWIVMRLPAGLPIYWVMFNTLGILQQAYINWHSKQDKLDKDKPDKIDKNPSLAIEGRVVAKEATSNREEDKASDSGDQAGREKGGKKNNGSARSRKKRKKR